MKILALIGALGCFATLSAAIQNTVPSQPQQTFVPIAPLR